MITPRWVHSEVQPIAIRNVLDYLTGCLENRETAGLQLDIGGPNVLTYAGLFQIYAQEAGLPRRVIVPVPVFTPRLSSYWIHLVTPMPAAIARPLAEGLRNKVVVRDSRIRDLVPIELITCREAIRSALERFRQDAVETCWLDSPQPPPEWPLCEDPDFSGGTTLTSEHRVVVRASLENAWKPIIRFGGRNGYYSHQRLWRWRGWADRIFGGPGMRRKRRDPDNLEIGDVFDFWRVVAVEPPHRLRLMAEVKSPGRAYLEFNLKSLPEGQIEIGLKKVYYPKGAAGLAYWRLGSPLRDRMLIGMLHGLADRLPKSNRSR